MTLLLCDVGGTHVRFATGTGPVGMGPPEKLRVDAHTSLEHAIARYLSSHSILADQVTALYLAFSNRNSWATTETVLRAALPKATLVQVNDFEANAMGLLHPESGDLAALNVPQGQSPSGAAKVVLGVGTGLGLAYIETQEARGFVRRTHGGHMLPAMSLPEHRDLFQALASEKKDGTISIYEDVLSGSGLFALYRYLCHRAHLNPEYHDVSDLLISGKDDPVMQQTLKLFHEILGVFTHQAVAFGYAYGGVFLTGGVIDKLMTSGLFQAAAFLSGFHQKNVPIVIADVLATPVWWVKDEFVSLRGLLHQARAGVK